MRRRGMTGGGTRRLREPTRRRRLRSRAQARLPRRTYLSRQRRLSPCGGDGPPFPLPATSAMTLWNCQGKRMRRRSADNLRAPWRRRRSAPSPTRRSRRTSHDPASGGQGLRPSDPGMASGGQGFPPWTRALRDACLGPRASRRTPKAARPHPPGPGRTSSRALHLDQAGVARPGGACATGCPLRQVTAGDLGGRLGSGSCF